MVKYVIVTLVFMWYNCPIKSNFGVMLYKKSFVKALNSKKEKGGLLL